MDLSNLRPGSGSTHHDKRLGRGEGSGHGGTAGRGNKGAQSRSGYKRKPGFEGGQMPLQRRLPKFGFKNPGRVEYKAINISTVQEVADKSGASVITHEVLEQCGVAKTKHLVKILGGGELKSKLEVRANAFSASAKAAIEAAGGQAITL